MFQSYKFKCLVLSNKQNQKTSVCKDIEQNKATNPDTGEAG